ncbi:unnamed protein product [Dimorphilus gyrociliatus]|uniref:G-protein coupled receptors family 1 profile domain-containing protein n=1 Tax=Dimorphilus gyrociliatus TaxID=2664684 RepID=A0A7I8W947_9ANNE|nr:unnamed protein product [Dimorphilus gyrociliatus]
MAGNTTDINHPIFNFQCFISTAMSLGILLVNCIILLVLFKSEGVTAVNRNFFTSMSIADALISFIISPFVTWNGIFQGWLYGAAFCHIQSYLCAICWLASLYSLMWMSIDHYVAVNKPDRYGVIMTDMRSRCWVMFVWIAAFSFCCPPLFGVSRATYYPDAFICLIDWKMQKAYFIASGLLVITPPTAALAVTNSFLWSRHFRLAQRVCSKIPQMAKRPQKYAISAALCLLFFVSWIPWCTLQLYEHIGLDE